ncbi:MAG: hypothetical protein NTX49_09835 [Chlamydiae bacterium]|nr:hypothetical protein [Chlamydiota bacterium]
MALSVQFMAPTQLWQLAPLDGSVKPLSSHPLYGELSDAIAPLALRVSGLKATKFKVLQKEIKGITAGLRGIVGDLRGEQIELISHFTPQLQDIAQRLISKMESFSKERDIPRLSNAVGNVKRDLAPQPIHIEADCIPKTTDVASLVCLAKILTTPIGVKEISEVISAHNAVAKEFFEGLDVTLQDWICHEIGKKYGCVKLEERVGFGRAYLLTDPACTRNAVLTVIVGVNFLRKRVELAKSLSFHPFVSPEQLQDVLNGFVDYPDFLPALPEYVSMQRFVRSIVHSMDRADFKNLARDVAHLNGRDEDISWGMDHLFDNLAFLESSANYVVAEFYSDSDRKDDLAGLLKPPYLHREVGCRASLHKK